MSENSGTVGAGWLHAEGDPPGTQRYWDGSAWQGEPQPAAAPAPAQPQVAPPPVMSPPPTFAPPPTTAAPAGYGSSALAAPKKKSSAWKWVLGVFLVLALGVGGCSFVFWQAVKGPIDAGNNYLAALEAQDFDQAWALSDPSCFEGGGPAQLAAVFGPDAVTAYDLNSSNVSSNNGSSTGSTSGTVTLGANDVRAIEINLSKRADDWLVCGFDIAPPG